MFPLLKKYNVKTAWGTDIIFDPKLAKRHGAQIVKWQKWYTLRSVALGDGNEWRIVASVRPGKPLSGLHRRSQGRGLCRYAAGGRQSIEKSGTCHQSGQKFRDDHERRRRVQKYARCKISRQINRIDTGFTKAKSLICSGVLSFQFQYDTG